MTWSELSDDGVAVRAHRNESSLPPPEHVIAALRSIDADLLRYYPVALQQRTAEALARRLGVDPACVVLGNGADDVLGALAQAFVSRGGRAVCVTPSFDTYARAVDVAGGALFTLPYRRRWEFDVQQFISLAGPGAKLVILGHPNNPTGESLAPNVLEYVARSLPRTLIVVDEVYLAFSERSLVSMVERLPNVAVVGSFSKVAALAGLRIGYAVARPSAAAVVRGVMRPFPVGAASLVAAAAYAGGGPATDDFERALARQVERSLDAIVAALQPIATSVWRGASNFVLADVGKSAPELAARLGRQGVAVRSFADPALEGCLRFCAMDDRSTSLLLEALDA